MTKMVRIAINGSRTDYHMVNAYRNKGDLYVLDPTYYAYVDKPNLGIFHGPLKDMVEVVKHETDAMIHNASAAMIQEAYILMMRVESDSSLSDIAMPGYKFTQIADLSTANTHIL